mgnify:CR=1 FL=1
MPTVISLIPDRESQDRLGRYARSLVCVEPKNSFHTTVFYAEETPIFPNVKIFLEYFREVPIILNPDSYSLDVFENNVVLRYDSQAVVDINSSLRSEAMRQMVYDWPNLRGKEKRILELSTKARRTGKIYPNFNPHISLARKGSGKKLEGLEKFVWPIVLEQVRWKMSYAPAS